MSAKTHINGLKGRRSEGGSCFTPSVDKKQTKANGLTLDALNKMMERLSTKIASIEAAKR